MRVSVSVCGCARVFVLLPECALVCGCVRVCVCACVCACVRVYVFCVCTRTLHVDGLDTNSDVRAGVRVNA